VSSGERSVWGAAATLSVVSAALWIAWGIHSTDAFAIVIAAITVASSVPVAMMAPRERRMLAVMLVVIAPVIGPLAAAAAILAKGRGSDDLMRDPAAAPRRIDGTRLARQLTHALPPCEALVSGDIEKRRATISRLAGRANAEDLMMLRWAKTRQDPELAVEIALALEDIDQRFEAKLRVARLKAGATPSCTTHRELFQLITQAILTGVADLPLIPKLASEARIHYDAAIAAESSVRGELLATRARLELAMRRPELVVQLLDDSVKADPRGELVSLYIDAAYAMRAFDVIATFEAHLADAA
jgi:hypothetical protein